MAKNPLLRGSAIVGAHGEQGVGLVLGGPILGLLTNLEGIVATHAEHDRQTTGIGLDHRFDHLLLLLQGNRGCFTRRPEYHQKFDPAIHQMFPESGGCKTLEQIEDSLPQVINAVVRGWRSFVAAVKSDTQPEE